MNDQQHIITLLESARASVLVALEIEQRTSHRTHPDPRYKEIESRLDWLVNSERALLKRIETVGR